MERCFWAKGGLLWPSFCREHILGFLQLLQTTIGSWEGHAPQGLRAMGTAPARPEGVTEAQELVVPAKEAWAFSKRSWVPTEGSRALSGPETLAALLCPTSDPAPPLGPAHWRCGPSLSPTTPHTQPNCLPPAGHPHLRDHPLLSFICYLTLAVYLPGTSIPGRGGCQRAE